VADSTALDVSVPGRSNRFRSHACQSKNSASGSRGTVRRIQAFLNALFVDLPCRGGLHRDHGGPRGPTTIYVALARSKLIRGYCCSCYSFMALVPISFLPYTAPDHKEGTGIFMKPSPEWFRSWRRSLP
jgi:hypothetical protein